MEEIHTIFSTVCERFVIGRFDCRNVEDYDVTLYTKLPDVEGGWRAQCQTWVKSFSEATGTRWLVSRTLRHPERFEFRGRFSCVHSKLNKCGGKGSTGRSILQNQECNDSLKLKIKKNDTTKKDPYLRRYGFDTKIEIHFVHSHRPDEPQTRTRLGLADAAESRPLSRSEDGPSTVERTSESRVDIEGLPTIGRNLPLRGGADALCNHRREICQETKEELEAKGISELFPETQTKGDEKSGQFVHIKLEPWYEIMESEPRISPTSTEEPAGMDFDLPSLLTTQDTSSESGSSEYQLLFSTPELVMDITCDLPPLVPIQSKQVKNVNLDFTQALSKRRSIPTEESCNVPPLVKIQRNTSSQQFLSTRRDVSTEQMCDLPPLVRIQRSSTNTERSPESPKKRPALPEELETCYLPPLVKIQSRTNVDRYAEKTIEFESVVCPSPFSAVVKRERPGSPEEDLELAFQVPPADGDPSRTDPLCSMQECAGDGREFDPEAESATGDASNPTTIYRIACDGAEAFLVPVSLLPADQLSGLGVPYTSTRDDTKE